MGILDKLANPLGSAIGGIMGVGATALQNRAQKKAQKREFAYNKEMWNLANHYNAPEQQMARLEQAGLNPNLVYGNGSVVGNTSTQTPKYQAPNLQRLPTEQINPMEILGQFQDLRTKKATADLTENTALVKKNEARWIDQKNAEDVIGKMFANLEAGIRNRGIGVHGKTGKAKLIDFNHMADKYKATASPYMNKYQAEVRSSEQQNDLRQLELDFYEEFGSKPATNALMQLIKILK